MMHLSSQNLALGTPMTYSHAVLWMDHQEGHLVRFNAESHDSIHVRAYEGKQKLHTRAGTLGAGKVQTPDYFPNLARVIDTAEYVLVVGAGVAKNEFAHYLESTKPSIRAKVLGIENSERITEPQLLAYAKKWFKPVDRMRAIGL
jgi:stalled ribosome rescue protein Dom34